MMKRRQGSDDIGALESDIRRIDTIRGDEALGYSGRGREEHTGEIPSVEIDVEEELANNRPGDVD